MGKQNRKVLGVLGGLGPYASAWFYDLVNQHTLAATDQDHLDLLLSSRASTPDRTAFILGESPESPLPALVEEVIRLEKAGAGVLAMPCNTSHYFYHQVAAAARVPLLNMVALTAQKAMELGCTRLGILATAGTVAGKVYQSYCEAIGLDWAAPDEAGQKALMRVIYEDIKAGKAPDMDAFYRVAEGLLAAGCERLVLGCTELSLLKRAGLENPERYIDSMEVLAEAAITACGGQPTGFVWVPV